MITLNSKEHDILEQIIITEFLQGRSFTSLDVTNKFKAMGYSVRNHKVATWLRENVIATAYSLGQLYNQTLITVDSKVAGITHAYLYHHYLTPSDSYLDRDQNPQPFTPKKVSNDTVDDTMNAHPSTSGPSTFFGSRQLARDYAKTHKCKVMDNGVDKSRGHRWYCM